MSFKMSNSKFFFPILNLKVVSFQNSPVMSRLHRSESLVVRDQRLRAPCNCVQAQGDIISFLGLVRNLSKMSFGDQRRFWAGINKLSRSEIVNTLDVSLRKIFYNGKRCEYEILRKNFKLHAHQLDRAKREIFETILEKYLCKIRAQALFDVGLDVSNLNKMFEQNGSIYNLVKDFKMVHSHDLPIIQQISDLISKISISKIRQGVISVVVFLMKLKFDSVSIYDFILLLNSVGALDSLICSVSDLAGFVLNSCKRSGECVYAQSSTEHVMVESIFQAVVMFVKDIIAPDLDNIKVTSIRSKRIFEVWRSVKSVDEMIRAIIKFVEIAQEKVVKYICGYSLKERNMFLKLPGLDVWYDDVNQMYVEQGNFNVTISPVMALRAKKNYSDGLEYLKTLRSLRCPLDVMSVFMNTFGMCKELFLHAQSMNATSKTRIPPLVVHFYGGAGLGKSTLCQYVIGDLAKTAGFVEYSNDLIYIRDVQQEFWDGYSGQFATIYDDIFQSDDATKRGLEAIELVRANNTMQMPLHMADISQKGNMCFSSKLILLTSNPPRERCIGISTTDAFWRRRDFVFRIVPNEKFCKRISVGIEDKFRVDVDKVVRECGKKYSTQIYLFDMEDVETGDIIHSNLTYEQMVSYVSNGYINKYSSSCDLIKEVEERFYAQGLVDNFISSQCETDIYYDVIEPVKNFVSVNGMKLFEWAKNLLTLRNLLPLLDWLPLITTSLGFFYTMWLAMSTKETVVPEHNISGDGITRRKVVNNRVKGEYNISGDPHTRRVNSTRLIKGEGSIDNNCFDFASQRLWKNTCMIHVYGDSGCIKMRGMFVKGKILMAPAHLLEYSQRNNDVDVYSAYGDFKMIPFGTLKVRLNKDMDICFIEFPKYIVDFPDISKNFIYSKDVKSARIDQALMYKYDGTQGCRGVIHKLDHINIIGKQVYELDTDRGVVPCQIIEGMKYETFTAPGMCGSPVLAMSTVCDRKIIGLHVAGSMRYGYCNILTSEFVQKELEMFGSQIVPEELELMDSSGSISNLKAEGNAHILGRVKRENKIFYPSSTEIVPSLIHGVLAKPVTMPAVLKRDGICDPLLLGVRKYMDPPMYLDEDILWSSSCSVKNDILPVEDFKKRKRVLSVREAMNGVVGDEYITSMNWNTSVGYPFLKMNLKGKGKYKLIDEIEPNIYMPNKLLMEYIENRLEKARNGIGVPTIWVDNLKDERRPISKVEQFKTRVFVTGPFDYTVLFRQYFLGFTAFIMDNRDKLECQVGVNPHSYEWTELYRRLNVLGDDNTWIAGDFSSYDGVLPNQVLCEVCDIVNEWYGDDSESQLIRKVLFMSIHSSYHIFDDLIYRVNHGNPSGNPFTAVMNSIANSILMRYVYIILASRNNSTIASYCENIRAVNYGDDNLIHVSQNAPWYNMIDIADIFEDIGIRYTPAEKGEELVPFISNVDITFLKRKFVWNDKVKGMLAPLDWSSIMEMLNWIRDIQDPSEALRANVRSALYELFHYGIEVYKSTKLNLDKALISVFVRPFDDTWYHYMGLWSSEHLFVHCDPTLYLM